TLHHVEDQLVVALGRQDDERVGDVVRDDAHLLLEDRGRALELPGCAGRRSGRPAGKRDATRAARGSGYRPGGTAAQAPRRSADPAAPTEAPTGAAGASPRKPSPGGSRPAPGLLGRDPAAAEPAPP